MGTAELFVSSSKWYEGPLAVLTWVTGDMATAQAGRIYPAGFVTVCSKVSVRHRDMFAYVCTHLDKEAKQILVSWL